MVLCAMVGCGNRSQRDKEKSYYRLPSVISTQGSKTFDLSKKRQAEWLAKIKREDIKKDQYGNVRVCSDHFISGAPAKLYDVSNPDWSSSLKLGYKSFQSNSSTQRYGRIVKRSSRKRAREEENNETDDVVERNHVEHNVEDAGNKEVENVKEIEDGKAVQTNMTSLDIAEMEDESQYMEQVRKEMENEIGRLKKEVDEY